MYRRRKVLYYIPTIFIILFAYYSGLLDYINTKDFKEFDYPYSFDIKPYIEEMKLGNVPKVKPMNDYPYQFITNFEKCDENIYLLILVKSAVTHFDQRRAIRATWGQESYRNVAIKTMFFLGTTEYPEIQKKVNDEIKDHEDIIQMNFVDNYFNNTIKTMMAFRWAYENCYTAPMYLFSDDDMYISVANLISYSKRFYSEDFPERFMLYAGYVFQSRPLRYKFSKWRVSLDEYPWHMWPPYVSAGAYLVSKNALETLYLGSYLVKHFRFDDIFLGIVALKTGIEPLHCDEFYFYKKPFSIDGYKSVIASHGYSDPKELIKVWRPWNFRDYPRANTFRF